VVAPFFFTPAPLFFHPGVYGNIKYFIKGPYSLLTRRIFRLCNDFIFPYFSGLVDHPTRNLLPIVLFSIGIMDYTGHAGDIELDDHVDLFGDRLDTEWVPRRMSFSL